MNHGSPAAALVAAAVVIGVVPLVKRLAERANAVARPKIDRWHTRTVPLLGGVAIFAGVTAGWLMSATRDVAFMSAFMAGTGMFALGLLDDLVKLKPSTKLVGQIVVACAVVFIRVPPLTASGTMNAFLAILWIVSITNAVNLLDNMDGLCAGVAAIASVGSWLQLAGSPASAAALAAAVFGASAGFLVYNFRPASIFMGDAGSLFLGGSLAVLSLSGSIRTATGIASALAVPVFLLLIPIFDTAFVTVSRLLSTRPASRGGRDHTSHRLVAMGFSESQAVLILWILAAAGGAIVVVSRYVGPVGTVLIGPLLLIALTLFGIQLARVAVYEGEDFSLLIDKPYTPLLVDVTYRRRLFEVFLDLILITFSYIAAYVIRFDRDMPVYYTLIERSLPIVVACQLLGLFLAGVYRGTWRYIGLGDVTTYGKGIVMGVLSSVMALVLLYRFDGYSRGVFVIDLMIVGLVVPGSRLSFRVIGDAAGRRRQTGSATLVYGAGDAGALLVTELRNNADRGLVPVAFLDDDQSKHGKRILRLPVLGGFDHLGRTIVRKGAEVVVISTTTLPAERVAAIEAVCHASGTRLLQMRFGLEAVSPMRRPSE
jgi:UDP-GlcNAc:undecaprenyl-phosphate GlcNAc-1-phosphate transferase